MKKNLGFVLFETLIVSTLVLGTLIFLFVQISTLKESYSNSFKNNTIPNLYKLQILSNCLEQTGYRSLQTSIDNSNYGYIDLISNRNSLGSLCNKIIDDENVGLNIKNILMTNSDIKVLKANLNNIDISLKFKKFIEKLPDIKGINNRLIAEFNDETYASIIMNADISNLNNYTLINLIKNGGFEDGLNGWISSNTMSTTNILKKSGNNSLNMETGSISQNITLENNHTYFFYVDLYTSDILDNNNYLKISYNENDYINKTFDDLTIKKWNNYSNLFTSNTSLATLTLYLSANTIINLDSFMLVDVTNLFNDEPNLEWCQKNISFIQDTDIIYK